MEIGIRLDPKSAETIKHLKMAKLIIRSNLSKELDRGLNAIISTSRYKYLLGPRPSRLGRVTGRLYASMGKSIDMWRRNKIEGEVGSGVGGKFPVPYNWIHERGFKGTEHVSGHTRMQTHIFGMPTPPFPVWIPPHARKMNMPARPYIITAIFENYLPIARKLMKAIRAGVRGKRI